MSTTARETFTSPVSRPLGDSSKRSLVACDRCRGRKTKCLGVAPYPCRSCEKAGAECVYPHVPKRIYVSEKEWNDLQAKVEALSPPETHVEGIFSPAAAEGLESEGDESWGNDQQILVLTRGGEHLFVGPASSTYLATLLQPENRNNVAFDVSPLHHADLLLRRDQSPTLPGLPPFETAKRWYTAQFAYIGSIFAFIQPRYFEDRLVQVYNRSLNMRNRDGCLVYCQILLIIAFGQMYSLNEWASHEGPPGFSYFQTALKLLPDIHEEGSVLFVEVLGLVAYFMQILNRRDTAFLYVGLAVRMAISLGLHQEVADSNLDDVELEHRRRVWWTTYSMDRILCVKSGNPVSIHDDDINVSWPSPLPALDIDTVQPQILAGYTQLSRILGRIGEQIYRKRHSTGTTLVTSMQSIMQDLESWLRNIPPELKLDFSSLDARISRESVSAFLHYYQCINMTGRPLLFRVCQRRMEALASGNATTNWQDGLSQNAVHSIQNSMFAACAATSVINAAAKHNLLATYGFMDGEHAFSAALVLVMVNAAFPYDDRNAASMELALSVLYSMARRGNEYIKARHALLLNLRNSLSQRATRAGSGSSSDSARSSKLHTGGENGEESNTSHQNSTDPQGAQFEDLTFTLDLAGQNDELWDAFSGDDSIDIASDWINSFEPEAI